MNMKKTLAGVMAGAMAVSAMAATVSADEGSIVLNYDLKTYVKDSDPGKATFTFDYAKSLDNAEYKVAAGSDLYFEINQALVHDKGLKAAEISVTGTKITWGTSGEVRTVISNTYKFSTSADDVLADPNVILVNDQTGKDPQNREIFKDVDGDKYKEFHVPTTLLSSYSGAALGLNADASTLYFDSIVVRLTYEVPAQTTDRVADGWTLWQANGEWVNWAYTDDQYKELGIDPYSTVDVNLLHLNTGLSYSTNGVNAVLDNYAGKFSYDAAFLADYEQAKNALDGLKAQLTTMEATADAKKADYEQALRDKEDGRLAGDDLVPLQEAEDAAKAAWDKAVADVEAKKKEIAAQEAYLKLREDLYNALTAANPDLAAIYWNFVGDLGDYSWWPMSVEWVNQGGAVAATPKTVAATGLVAGATKENVYPMKSSLTKPANVVEAISARKAGGNHYTRPLAVLNDAIANGEEVTFTFTSFNGYVATHESHLYHQWVNEGIAYGYQTSKYDWYNPTFGQHLYTDRASVNDGYSLFGSDNYDMYGSYSTLWGQNLFNSGLVINESLTMQLNDTQVFIWGDNSVSFTWSELTNDGNITRANQLLASMLLYTPIDWYWDSLTVTVGGESTEDVETGEGLDGEGETIEDEETDIIEEIPFEEEEEEPEVVVEEEPVVEEVVTEPAPVVEEPVVEEVVPVPAAPSPQTGNAPVALAVIPVALAAAAVVAKKRG